MILTVFLQELKGDVLFLFLGSMAVATVVEWFAGKILERMKQKKWWDYICLQYSALWGLLGFLAVQYGNGIILGVYHSRPDIVEKAVILGLTAVGVADFMGSLLFICHMEEKLPRLSYGSRGFIQKRNG